jgi:Tol biopolymer transport system component
VTRAIRVVVPFGRTAVVVAVVAFAAEIAAAQFTGEPPRLVARQRIRRDRIEVVGASSIGQNGQLVAFVARDSSSQSSCCQDIYVIDRSSGEITKESVSGDGATSHGDSQAPSLSADGRILAFETIAPDLPPTGATRRRVIVRDRASGIMRTLVSAGGTEPDGGAGEPAVSGDGRVVVFTSDATNLVSEPDANGRQTDIYAWQLDNGQITRISVGSDGAQPLVGSSHSPRVSRDGAVVAFVSTARLAPADANTVADVYVRDLRHPITLLIGGGVAGAQNGASAFPALSADGRHVAFESLAALDRRDRNNDRDVYIFDVAARTTTLVSMTSKGHSANAESRRPALSDDGQVVTYQSLASNLGSGQGCPRAGSDTNLLPDVYAFDRATCCVARISGSSGSEWWAPSVAPAIDASGGTIVFSSTQPSHADDPTTDFDLFHALIRKGTVNVYGRPGTQGAMSLARSGSRQLVELRHQSP